MVRHANPPHTPITGACALDASNHQIAPTGGCSITGGRVAVCVPTKFVDTFGVHRDWWFCGTPFCFRPHGVEDHRHALRTGFNPSGTSRIPIGAVRPGRPLPDTATGEQLSLTPQAEGKESSMNSAMKSTKQGRLILLGMVIGGLLAVTMKAAVVYTATPKAATPATKGECHLATKQEALKDPRFSDPNVQRVLYRLRPEAAFFLCPKGKSL